ncbi:MAG TPA: hypothetical protein VKD72_36115, partial [Gemmataceae bacterium]|nr:hypothetical protein [Gemmataceae bacterium]
MFVALDEELDREVALKEIQARHADHAESRARFLTEARVTGVLEHPGIVPVYGHVRDCFRLREWLAGSQDCTRARSDGRRFRRTAAERVLDGTAIVHGHQGAQRGLLGSVLLSRSTSVGDVVRWTDTRIWTLSSHRSLGRPLNGRSPTRSPRRGAGS